MAFYITTPIYYVNDEPHIGHAYTTIIADIFSRYHRLFGEDSFLLTGTDEHGQKVQAAAKARDLDPQTHVDQMVVRFQDAWRELEIQNDIFMRTTEPFHYSVVQQCLQELYDRDEIYLHEYEGWYSVSEEIFYTDKDLVDGKSPTGKVVQRVVEKNYFFRMSKYQQRLIDYINANPSFLQPDGKRSEILGFLRQPLNDLCISRPVARLNWGIPLPFDDQYVTYVWFDALINYVSAIGYRQGPEREAEFNKWWPAAVHLIGKDILTTHAVYWPTMLMALGIALPKAVFAHGWWLNSTGEKMSKSEGTVIKPAEVVQKIGVEQFRYFLAREIVFGNDAKFSYDGLVQRLNAELANNLGNLLSRSIQLVTKNFAGEVPALSATPAPESVALSAQIGATATIVRREIVALSPSTAIGAVIELLSATNRYFDSQAPWKAVKEDPSRAAECLYTVLDVLRAAATMLSPVMPNKCAAIRSRLGLEPIGSWEDASRSGMMRGGSTLVFGEPVFPRLEVAKVG